MREKLFLSLLALCILSPLKLWNQNIEDALRYSSSYFYTIPRAGALNVAYHGIMDDVAALWFNPAGLALINKNEISLGFGLQINSTETNYLGNVTKLSSSDFYMNHLGLVAPFAIGDKNASFAIGYYLESNFDNRTKYSGFNTYSTYIDFQAMNSPGNENDNLSVFLYLAWLDSNNNVISPLKNRLQQTAFIDEGGGIHNVSVGLGFNLTDNFSVGASLTTKWGGYKYNRQYTESDINNVYNIYDTITYSEIDFNSLSVIENLNQNIVAVSGSIGLQGRIGEFMRIGAAIKFPTIYHIDEDFSITASAQFDDPGFTPEDYYSRLTNDYNIITPFVLSAGASVHWVGLTIAAGFEYSDITELEFRDAQTDIMAYNIQIPDVLQSQLSYGFGAEYEVPETPLFIRGSYATRTSPYSSGTTDGSINTISLGAGILVAENVRLDGLFQYYEYSNTYINYGNVDYKFTKKPVNVGLQLTYRFK